MDLLHLAQHRFQQLASRLLQPMTEQTSDDVERWLRDQVCAAVEPLTRSAPFQRIARWSPDHLGPGATTEQRRLVERVDRALIKAARHLVTATDELEPLHVVGDTRLVAPSPVAAAAPRTPAAEPVPVLEWIAGRPWFDLVCPDEYFTGHRGLHLLTGRIDCTDEFLRELDPRVPLGDYVARGMFARIEFFARKIDDVWRLRFHSAQGEGQACASLAERLFTIKIQLDRAIDELRKACHKGRATRLRDACATLTLVYAAYAPNPDLGWLGCPEGSPAAEASCLRATVRPPSELITAKADGRGRLRVVGGRRALLCRPDVVQGIAGALAVAAELYRRPAETEDAIDWLRQQTRLLLVDQRPRTAYWDGQPFGQHWDQFPVVWDLLWELARRARQGRPLQAEDVTPPGHSTTAVKHRRSRLSKEIPAALDALIDDVRPKGYRLQLERDEIALMSVGDDQQLVEVGLEVTKLVE
jgi:hypothetical protein